MNRRGFTLVEAVIVLVVIAVLLAVIIPYMRERERARFQVLADTEPWEVFEFRATPTKEVFGEDEEFVIECEFTNSTKYALELPERLDEFSVTLGDTDIVVVLPENITVGQFGGVFPPLPESALTPGESARTLVRFVSLRGAADVRIACMNRFGSGSDKFKSNPFRLIVRHEASFDGPTFDKVDAIYEHAIANPSSKSAQQLTEWSRWLLRQTSGASDAIP